MKYTRNHYTIGLDAHHDLYVAGMDTDEDAVAEFEDKYCEAAEELEQKLGITISVISRISYDGPCEEFDTDEEAWELWQEIHNLV